MIAECPDEAFWIEASIQGRTKSTDGWTPRYKPKLQGLKVYRRFHHDFDAYYRAHRRFTRRFRLPPRCPASSVLENIQWASRSSNTCEETLESIEKRKRTCNRLPWII